MPDSDYRRAQQHYARIRTIAFDVARQTAAARSGIERPFRFTEIDDAALYAWRQSWQRPQPFGYGGWKWPELVRPVWRRPAGFTLALWSGDCLCGPSVGRPSRRRRSGIRHTLSLYYLEGNPDPEHPLRGHVAELAIGVAETYARALRVSRLRLVEPLPGVFRVYERLGYAIVREGAAGVYFEKRM